MCVPHINFYLYCKPESVLDFCVVMHRNHQKARRQWLREIQLTLTPDQEALALQYMGEHYCAGPAPGIFFDPCPTGDLLGGALRARSAAISVFGHTRDPYFEILGASLLPLAHVLTSDFVPLFGDLEERTGYVALPPSFGPPRRQG